MRFFLFPILVSSLVTPLLVFCEEDSYTFEQSFPTTTTGDSKKHCILVAKLIPDVKIIDFGDQGKYEILEAWIERSGTKKIKRALVSPEKMRTIPDEVVEIVEKDSPFLMQCIRLKRLKPDDSKVGIPATIESSKCKYGESSGFASYSFGVEESTNELIFYNEWNEFLTAKFQKDLKASKKDISLPITICSDLIESKKNKTAKVVFKIE